jgi:stage II sporulation protein P
MKILSKGSINKKLFFLKCMFALIIFCIVMIFCLNILILFYEALLFDGMKLINVCTDSGKEILKLGLPFMNISQIEKRILETPEEIFNRYLYFFTEIDVAEPKTFLVSCIGFLNIKEIDNNFYENISFSSELLEEEAQYYLEKNKTQQTSVETDKDNIRLSPNPLVAIYNTHNAESFIPTDGTAKIEGKNAGVAKVAKTLAETLEKEYGIKTVISDTIHDYPRWEESYINSAKTVRNLINKYPSLEIIIDVHRDAGLPKKMVTTLSNNKKSATIMLVVGSDKRLPHPNWKENWEFAKKIGGKMDELYPGLLKEVRVQTGRYNQNLHKRAILAEVGSSKNSLEEAQEAAKAFAVVINEIIKEEKTK